MNLREFLKDIENGSIELYSRDPYTGDEEYIDDSCHNSNIVNDSQIYRTNIEDGKIIIVLQKNE